MNNFRYTILFFCVVTSLFLCSSCQRNSLAQNEVLAIKHLSEINTAQLQYSITKGKGNFIDLATLGQEGLIDRALASGEKDGYVFRVMMFDRTKELPAMLDITARLKSKAAGGRSLLYK